MFKAPNSRSSPLHGGAGALSPRQIRFGRGVIKLSPKEAWVYLAIALLVTGLTLAALFLEQQNNK